MLLLQRNTQATRVATSSAEVTISIIRIVERPK